MCHMTPDLPQVGWKSSMPYLGRFLGAQLFGAISARLLARWANQHQDNFRENLVYL